MAVCSFVKTMKNPNIRKRTANEIHDDEGEDRCFLHIAKKSTPMANSKLYFSTSSADSTKESKKVLFEYDSCKEIQVEHDSKATTTLQTETDISRDARAVRERALAARQSAEALKGDNNNNKGDNNNNKVYKGICNYIDHRAGFRREQTVYGPLRASAHIRVSARYDYQPDICKDYKATGCCGYGDSCKFMHDRGDYKSGWQIDREWEEAEKVRKRNLALGGHHAGDDEDDDDDEEDGNNSLPVDCQICKQPFVQAMVTKCRHYFCEHCVLKHQFKKRCFVCDQPTQGTFNVVRDLGKIMAC